MVINTRSRSPWLTAAGLDRPPLLEDARADVCVVGAGIAGMSVAYELALTRRSVIVIDQGTICGGMTGRTTAHFTNAFDDRYFRMEEIHGEAATRLLAESHTAAIERAVGIAVTECIDCDVERVDGYLFEPPEERDHVLVRELDATQRAGLSDVELVARAPLSWIQGPVLRFRNQMQLHPAKYLAGLARAIERNGGRIFGHTHADTIEGGAPALVQTERGPQIRAGHVVVATHSPVNDLAVIHTKQFAYQTYVIAAEVPRGSLPHALYWDTLDPYHYVRLATAESSDPPRDVLIVGGEDHRTGQSDRPEEAWRRLESWTRARFKDLGAIEWRWSGEVFEPVDGVAFIGRNPLDARNVYVATGDSGNGMTHGVIAGLLIRDLVEGRENRWSELYDPRRRRLRVVGEYAKDNLGTLKEYAAWLSPGEVKEPSRIPRGEGALVRRGLELCAVYVDAEGHVHENLALCPHLGCAVKWNRAEKTWDCPCHGSRFDARGKVIHGPAIVDLLPAREHVRDRADA